MGDIADMMLEGTLCEGCGEFMGDGDGYARRCRGCRDERQPQAAKPGKKEWIKPGHVVDYWRGARTGKPSGRGEITEVGVVGSQRVAWIKGCSGCIAVTHLAPAGAKQ